MHNLKSILILTSLVLFLSGCKGGLPGADARKVSYKSTDRVKKNIEEGRGFRLDNLLEGQKGGDFEFASSNELWRASLDVIDFMPLASANYSGGMIITDWYADSNNPEESLKLTIRFMTNEIRSDALKVIIHKKNCKTLNDCSVTEISNSTNNEIRLAILKKAAEIEKNDMVLKKEKDGEYKINKN